MPSGPSATYEVHDDQIIKGRPVPKGVYRGFTSATRSMNHEGGVRTTHWIEIDGDEEDITDLVETGAADRV